MSTRLNRTPTADLAEWLEEEQSGPKRLGEQELVQLYESMRMGGHQRTEQRAASRLASSAPWTALARWLQNLRPHARRPTFFLHRILGTRLVRATSFSASTTKCSYKDPAQLHRSSRVRFQARAATSRKQGHREHSCRSLVRRQPERS